MSDGAPRLGIDRLLDDPGRWLEGQRIGLLTNQAALTGDRRPTLEAVRRAPSLRLARLFTFEHGLSGFGEDARPVADAHDPRSGLPIISLYGPRRRPSLSDLDDLDGVVVDVQEVGVRCYTYATTVALLLEAAAERGTPVVVCDRPGLLGPHVAGPALEPEHRSFLGYLGVPFQHGLTIGEALRWHAASVLDGAAPLTVVPLEGWRRDTRAAAAFVPPSPGLPTRDAVALYPGLVLLEGANLSEGRGTPLPFSLLGAPWLDGYRLSDELADLSLPGVWFRPLDFEPSIGPFAGRRCGGVQLHVEEADALRPLEAGVRILARLRERYPRLRWTDAAAMPWAGEPGAGEIWHEPTHGTLLDGLAGSATLREAIETGDLDSALSAWRAQAMAFVTEVAPQLLYDPAPTPA